MSFFFASFASSSVASSSSYYPTVTRYYREPTPCELIIGTCLHELWVAFRSILGHTLLALAVLFIGNGVLKASMHGHLSYRDISLVALVGSPIIHGTFQLLLRACKNLPERMKLSWEIGTYTPSNPVFLWIFYPAIDGSLCGILGVLVLRSSNSDHAELISKMNFLFVTEAAAIGWAILFTAMIIPFGCCILSRKSFDPREYGFYIRRRTLAQSPQTQTQVPAAESPQHAFVNKPSTRTAKSESTDSTITVVPV